MKRLNQKEESQCAPAQRHDDDDGDNEMDGPSSEILEGLTRLQKIQVHEWMDEFRLSPQELAAWRKDREVFVKAVKYKMPIETPADFICRDIYELKLFGVRVADFFHKNGEPPLLKICGRVFTREEAMRWVLIQSHLKKPFLFSKGEPQRILNSLAGDTKPGRKRAHAETGEERDDKGPNSLAILSVVGGVRLEPQESGGERQRAKDEKPTQTELDHAAAEFSRRNPTKPQSVSGSHVEARISPPNAGSAPSAADAAEHSAAPEASVASKSHTSESLVPPLRSSRRAAPHNQQDGEKSTSASAANLAPGRSLARPCKVQTANARKTRIKLPKLDPASVQQEVSNTSTYVGEATRSNRGRGVGSTTVPTQVNPSQGSPSTVKSPIENSGQRPSPARTQLQPLPSPGVTVLTDRLLNEIALPAARPQPESPVTAVQGPVKYLVPYACENVAYATGQPIYSITTNATVQTVYPASTPSLAQDSSSKAYQAMVEIYLRQFKVDVTDFSDWLMSCFGSNSVPQGELFGRADLLLTTIENSLWKFDDRQTRDASAIASTAESIGVSKQSLEKWMSPEIRPLFHTDKTALKYNLFQRVFTKVDDSQISFLQQADEIIRYRTRPDFATIDLPRKSRKVSKFCVDLVKDVLEFFSLEPGVVDELPLGGNRRFRQILKRNPSIHAVQLLLNELGILISYRNEVSMFSTLFSDRDTAFCFETTPVCLPPTENMYHVPIEDAVKAVTLDRWLRNDLPGENVEDVDSEKIRELLKKY